MDALLTSATSGLRARTESLEMLANNLANQSSPGFKADRELYTLYLSPEAIEDAGGDVLPLPPTVPVIERHWTDFSQGATVRTGQKLDLALDGKGFFQAQGPSGPLYTRSGNFRLSAQRELVTGEGYRVMSDQGIPIRLDPNQDLEVTPGGDLRQQGQTIARLGLVEISQPEQLAKRAGTYFALADPAAATPARTLRVEQGYLETSNQPPAEAAARLILVMRQFEMLQRAIQIGSEMNRRADELARVGA